MRGTIEEERIWRNAIKHVSKLGDRKDMEQREALSNAALSNNDTVWKKMEI